jgi:hypothetical protein
MLTLWASLLKNYQQKRIAFPVLTNHRLAFSPHISPIETHCVSRTALMKLENLKHETRRVSVG